MKTFTIRILIASAVADLAGSLVVETSSKVASLVFAIAAVLLSLAALLLIRRERTARPNFREQPRSVGIAILGEYEDGQPATLHFREDGEIR